MRCFVNYEARKWLSKKGFFVLFQDDGAAVSIFALSGSNDQDGHLAAGRNGVKRLRTVSGLLYQLCKQIKQIVLGYILET